MEIRFSVIVPVYNRPEEVYDLLQSIEKQHDKPYEVILVEDGSSDKCDKVVAQFQKRLNTQYWYKENQGPGPARNFGVEKSSGNWIIFLDSDCTLPEHYFLTLTETIQKHSFDGYGGPDKEHHSFTLIQKAIAYSMTSFITTGGIRGSKKSLEKFKPRSFNMGMKRKIFTEVGGFGDLRFGEDLDLSLRLEKKGHKLILIPEAFVFHKRRTSFRKFYKQVYNSGLARVVLNKLHPGTLKPLHLLPLAFVIFHAAIIALAPFESKLVILLVPVPLIVLVDSFRGRYDLTLSLLCLVATYVQTFAYGLGLLHALFRDKVLGKSIRYAYRDNFYD